MRKIVKAVFVAYGLHTTGVIRIRESVRNKFLLKLKEDMCDMEVRESLVEMFLPIYDEVDELMEDSAPEAVNMGA